MLIEFSVGNYRSIKDIQTISFVATGLKSPEEMKEVDENNLVSKDGIELLKTVGIYGANGSGKSNILMALECFINKISKEPSSTPNLENLYDPFMFQDNVLETETYFQIVFFFKDKKYRYGLTVKRIKNIDKTPNAPEYTEIVSKEWLYGQKDKKLIKVFTRDNFAVDKNSMPNNDKIADVPFAHTLFLTHAAAFDKEGICAKLKNHISIWTIQTFSNGIESFGWNSIYFIETLQQKNIFLNLLKSFNLEYNDIIIKKNPERPNDYKIPHENITFTKYYLNEKNEEYEVKLNLKNNESSGTRKLFDLAGLLLRCFTWDFPILIIIDEIDSNFHPALLIKLLELFNNPQINKSNSQLVFTSHDTNLMSPSLMRRDQFYFTEKRSNNETKLYSLADLKGIRNSADFAKQYLAGFYGAIPILETFFIKSDEPTLEL